MSITKTTGLSSPLDNRLSQDWYHITNIQHPHELYSPAIMHMRYGAGDTVLFQSERTVVGLRSVG